MGKDAVEGFDGGGVNGWGGAVLGVKTLDAVDERVRYFESRERFGGCEEGCEVLENEFGFGWRVLDR